MEVSGESPGRLFGQLVLPDARAVGAGLPGLPGSCHSELLPPSPSARKLLRFPCGWGLSVLSGSSTVDFFPVFPRAFSPGVVMAPSHGFQLRRAGRLVASGSAELDSAQSSHSGVCAMRVGVTRCSLTRCGTSWLVPSGFAIWLNTAGLVSMGGPQLVSSAESQLCE